MVWLLHESLARYSYRVLQLYVDLVGQPHQPEKSSKPLVSQVDRTSSTMQQQTMCCYDCTYEFVRTSVKVRARHRDDRALTDREKLESVEAKPNERYARDRRRHTDITPTDGVPWPVCDPPVHIIRSICLLPRPAREAFITKTIIATCS